MRPTRLLIINPGWEQVDLVERARDSGYRLYALLTNGDTCVRTSDFDDLEEVASRDFQSATKIARFWSVDFIVSTQCDFSLEMQAHLSHALGLPGPGVPQAEHSVNKWLQRKSLQTRSSVRQPECYCCRDFESSKRAYLRLGERVIVKPVDNRGSIGVSIVESAADLHAAVSVALHNSVSTQIVVEQYISGTMFIVEGLGSRPISVGEKKMDDTYVYMNVDIMFARPDEDPLRARVASTHEAVCEALGYKLGLTSGEYMVDEYGEVWLIEVTNRAGGVWIGSKITQKISSIDPTAFLLDTFARGACSMPIDTARWVYLRYINLPQGEVTRISGTENWPGVDGYLAHFIWQPIPSVIGPVNNALSRSGILITYGSNQTDAKIINEQLLEQLKISYKGGSAHE